MGRVIRALRSLAALCALGVSLLLFRGPIEQQWLSRVNLARPTPGFMAEITSEPSSAEILIDGVPRGATPFVGNVKCQTDEPVRLEVRAAGWDSWKRDIKCREGGSLEVRARLER